MTLTERWKGLSDGEIINEMRMMFANFLSVFYLFTTDENSDQIRYCVEHGQDKDIETYGKKAGVCFSQK